MGSQQMHECMKHNYTVVYSTVLIEDEIIEFLQNPTLCFDTRELKLAERQPYKVLLASPLPPAMKLVFYFQVCGFCSVSSVFIDTLEGRAQSSSHAGRLTAGVPVASFPARNPD